MLKVNETFEEFLQECFEHYSSEGGIDEPSICPLNKKVCSEEDCPRLFKEKVIRHNERVKLPALSLMVNEAKRFKKMFEKINKDVGGSGAEEYRPLSDVDYYTEQILNIKKGAGEQCSFSNARYIAKAIKEISENPSRYKQYL